MTPNAALAGAVLGQLEQLGVASWVVCAGARNAPLVGSLLASQVPVHHHFDERTAAFFALGLAKKSRTPAAVVTTSGTAAAALLPASIEAFYSGIPLVLVTADRPRSYRGSGAPQTIDQAGLFGPHTALALDLERPEGLEALSAWDTQCPLHLNVCFEEPAARDVCTAWRREPPASRSAAPEPTMEQAIDDFCLQHPGLGVLVGELQPHWREPVGNFLKRLRAPVWADATSGLRERQDLSGLLLRSEPELHGSEAILRIGGLPTVRAWRDLESAEDIPVLSVAPLPFSGLARPSSLVVCEAFPDTNHVPREVPEPFSPDKLENALATFPRSEPAALRELSRHIPAQALVYLGNSLPIREWNLAATITPPHPHCFASRGANGIDGQIATFLGLSEGESESWGIFGDLTTLYDLNAPALLSQLSSGLRRIVIINNGGGRIFSRLPALRGLEMAQKIITENRHDRTFGPWAELWGVGYLRWYPGDPFPDFKHNTTVLEILPSQEQTDAFYRTLERR